MFGANPCEGRVEAMRIQVKRHEKFAVLRLGGRLTLDQIQELDETARSLLLEGFRFFVLNLIDVTDISSTGIGRILSLHRSVEVQKGAIVLTELSAVCEYVLELARLTDVFEIHKREEDAIRSVQIKLQ
jgi:anti-anti-sigma factor